MFGVWGFKGLRDSKGILFRAGTVGFHSFGVYGRSRLRAGWVLEFGVEVRGFGPMISVKNPVALTCSILELSLHKGWLTLRVHVPNNEVLVFWVRVLIIQGFQSI